MDGFESLILSDVDTGISNFSLWGNGLIAEDKFGHLTGCLDFDFVPFIGVRQKQHDFEFQSIPLK